MYANWRRIMNKKTIDVTDLRNNLSDALSAVDCGQTLLVRRRGKLQAALIDLDTYEDLLEASQPESAKIIKKARAEYERGETLTFDEVFGDI